MANKYTTAALASAEAQNLTAAEVLAADYAEIAALAKVSLGPNGESPDDFFYRHVRKHVAGCLDADAAEAIYTKRKTALESAITLSPDLSGLTVSQDEDGKIVIQ